MAAAALSGGAQRVGNPPRPPWYYNPAVSSASARPVEWASGLPCRLPSQNVRQYPPRIAIPEAKDRCAPLSGADPPVCVRPPSGPRPKAGAVVGCGPVGPSRQARAASASGCGGPSTVPLFTDRLHPPPKPENDKCNCWSPPPPPPASHHLPSFEITGSETSTCAAFPLCVLEPPSIEI